MIPAMGYQEAYEALCGGIHHGRDMLLVGDERKIDG
jgi:hypothetical protein